MFSRGARLHEVPRHHILHVTMHYVARLPLVYDGLQGLLLERHSHMLHVGFALWLYSIPA